MNTKNLGFGPAMILACDALGFDSRTAAACIVNTIPKEEAMAVKNADDVVRLIAKALTLHIEATIKRNAQKGMVAPLIDAEEHVNELYASAEGVSPARNIDIAQLVPGTGTLQ